MKILCLADLHIGETQLQKALIGELTGHLLEIQALSLSENPDVIINIVDATNLSRSLFFTTQLLELGIPVVAALNKHESFMEQECPAAEAMDRICRRFRGEYVPLPEIKKKRKWFFKK